MFRHKGSNRKPEHNLRIASILSFVAGIVNIAGFLAVQKLTTNVTGHFAFFVDEIFKLDLREALIYFLFIFFFFLGSFLSNILVEIVSKVGERMIYAIPVLIESIILFLVAMFGQALTGRGPNLLAFSLLFAMGLQNSLVTTISNAVVRTTHLTGLFTDLGIEVSQLFFYKMKEQKEKLYSSIKLRLIIISFFFFGGIVGAAVYSAVQLYVLAFAGAILLMGLVYDDIKQKLIRGFRSVT